MGNTCSICRHPNLKEIDQDLISGTSLRNIAERVPVSVTALHRHKTLHLAERLVRARQRVSDRAVTKAVEVDIVHGHNLLVMIGDLYARAQRLLDKAEAAEKYSAAASAIREATRLTELLGKLSGDISSGTTINTAVVITQQPEWVTLRSAILNALGPFPEARLAVGQALAGLQAGDPPESERVSDLQDEHPS